MAKNMKQEIITGIVILMLAAGYFAYPRIQGQRFETRAQHVISQFEARIEAYRAEHQKQLLYHSQNNPMASVYIPFWLEHIELWLSAINHQLFMQNQENLVDPFNYNHPSFNLHEMGFDTEIIGFIYIQRIGLRMPIYLGASTYHLNNGVAHLIHSSFPIGGKNTNAVIAGERNLYHGSLFKDIEQLEIGDEIHITNFMRTIIYTVEETKVIESHQIEAFAIQSGRDLVTLVTTHGNRCGNMRYIVVAERLY